MKAVKRYLWVIFAVPFTSVGQHRCGLIGIMDSTMQMSKWHPSMHNRSTSPLSQSVCGSHSVVACWQSYLYPHSTIWVLSLKSGWKRIPVAWGLFFCRWSRGVAVSFRATSLVLRGSFRAASWRAWGHHGWRHHAGSERKAHRGPHLSGVGPQRLELQVQVASASSFSLSHLRLLTDSPDFCPAGNSRQNGPVREASLDLGHCGSSWFWE